MIPAKVSENQRESLKAKIVADLPDFVQECEQAKKNNKDVELQYNQFGLSDTELKQLGEMIQFAGMFGIGTKFIMVTRNSTTDKVNYNVIAESTTKYLKPRYQWTIYFDGACEPKNPGGVSTIGWVLYDENNKLHANHHEVICEGREATNNVSEFAALESSIQYVIDNNLQGKVLFKGDSKLVVEIVNGRWKCKKPHLQIRLIRIQSLLKSLSKYKIEWIPREQNKEADKLTHLAYELHCNK